MTYIRSKKDATVSKVENLESNKQDNGANTYFLWRFCVVNTKGRRGKGLGRGVCLRKVRSNRRQNRGVEAKPDQDARVGRLRTPDILPGSRNSVKSDWRPNMPCSTFTSQG